MKISLKKRDVNWFFEQGFVSFDSYGLFTVTVICGLRNDILI